MHIPMSRVEGTLLAEIIARNFGPCTCDDEAECRACEFIAQLGDYQRIVEARRHKGYWIEGEGLDAEPKPSAPVAEPTTEDVPW